MDIHEASINLTVFSAYPDEAFTINVAPINVNTVAMNTVQY